MKKMARMNESLLMKQSVVFIEIGNDVIFDYRPLKQQLLVSFFDVMLVCILVLYTFTE